MNITLALLALPLLGAPPEAKAITEIPSKTLVECDSAPVCLATNEKGTALLVATEHGHVTAWNFAKAAFSWRNEPGGSNDHHNATSSMDVPYPRALAVGDKFAFFGRGLPLPSSLDVATGKETDDYLMLGAPGDQIVGLTCDPKDRWAWLALDSGVLVRYAPNSKTSYSRRSLKDVKVRSLAYDADASLVAAGSTTGTIHFVNASSANIDDDKLFKGPESPVTTLDFANKGALLLAGNEKGDVFVWTVATGKQKQAVKVGDAALTRVVVHPKNRWFVTGDASGLVKAWSLDKGEHVATFKADGATKVLDLEFVDGGKTLVGALGGRSIVMWDVAKL